MRTLFAILLLVPVALVKIVLVIIGLPAVWVKLKFEMDMREGVYQIGTNRPYTWHEAAIRNPVGGIGWLLNHPSKDEVITHGEVREPSDEKFVNGAKVRVPVFQWRFRRFRLLCSVRLLWIYPRRKHYGEMYLGWKLLSDPPELDFALSARIWAEVGN